MAETNTTIKKSLLRELEPAQLGKHAAVFVLYVMLWIPAWLFSINFETITDVVSWFIPAGIRISFLLFLPRRYWPVILLSEIAATRVISINFEQLVFENFLQIIIHESLMIAVYMFCIWQYLKRYGSFELARVRHLFGFLRWILTTVVLSAVVFNLNRPTDIELDMWNIIERVFAFALGDLVGIIAVLIPVSLTRSIIKKELDISSLPQVVVAAAFIAIMYLFTYSVSKEVATHIQVISLFLFILIAYKYQSLGSGISVISIVTIFILGNVLNINLGDPIDNQLFLIATTLTTLLIGAAIEEHNKLTTELKDNNSELAESNTQKEKLTQQLQYNNLALNEINEQLIKTLQDNQDMAKRLVTIQENERTQIARELHDQIGQNITAIKINLAVAKSSLKESDALELVDSTEEIADKMYGSTHELISSLYPRVLDEMGLEKALSRGNLRQMLDNDNITYATTFSGDIDTLDKSIALAIYRIAQEAINNTIKHANATAVSLSLSIDDKIIMLSISDDGEGFDPDSKTEGMGLSNIKNRVSAIGGTHSLTTTHSGTSHEVRFLVL